MAPQLVVGGRDRPPAATPPTFRIQKYGSCLLKAVHQRDGRPSPTRSARSPCLNPLEYLRTHPRDQEAISKPRALSGGTLVYGRPHVQAADLVPCPVSLSSGKVACEVGGDVRFAESVVKDPAGAAQQDLAPGSVNIRSGGIQELGHVGDAHAREQLIDLALNAYDPRERSAAVEVLGKTGGAGVVAALSRVLLYDRFDEVREVAATILGELRDPAARDALQRAESGDADGRVQVLAAEALKKLK